MRKHCIILILILCVISSTVHAGDAYDKKMHPFSEATIYSEHTADSIMKIVIAKARVYADAVNHYKSEIYIKGHTEILKKNLLIRFAHKIFPVDSRNEDILFEMAGNTEFTAPNNFKHTIYAANGNSIPDRKKQEEALNFLSLNVYTPVSYNESIIMPVAANSFRVYSFILEEMEEIDGVAIYKIRFTPKQWSQKLVSGNMWVRGDNWTIERIDINGQLVFAYFNLVMTFGKELRQFSLPEKADLKLKYSVLGNVVETNYHANYKFTRIEWAIDDYEDASKWKPLDLTQYYTITTDSVPIITDSAFWELKRDVPLSASEEYILQKSPGMQNKNRATGMTNFLNISEQLTNTLTFDFNNTHIRYSGILNPSQLGYSGRDGITYKQRLRINKTNSKGQQFYFRPEIGFVFNRKEVFFKLYGEWLYKPEKMGGISIMIANGNQSFSSEMMKEINEHLKDSVFNFDDLDLDFFRHYYMDIKNSFEPVNGLLLNTSISYHSRIPVKKELILNPGEVVEDIITETYNDFTPTIGFTYTPRQFYRLNGRVKEYIYSYYPTISVEYARAIPGIMGSSGEYGRIELDIHQSLPMHMLRKLNYHVSAGIYYNHRSTYFADFRFFTRRNFPDSWNDKIGGVFNLLKREWFNASNKYCQMHLMYESPFMISRLIDRALSRHILSERLYLGQLWTPALPSYTEIGYGLGNHIFNIGVFAGFEKKKHISTGMKFAFELFQ